MENNWNQSFLTCRASCYYHSYFDRFGDTDANNPFTPWLASLAPSKHKLSCSRIGVRRVSFNAYSRDQLKEILARNWDLDSSAGFDVTLGGDDFKFQVVSCCFYFPSLLHNRIPIDSWGPRLAPDQSRMTFVAGQETESSTSTGCFPGQGPSLSTVVFLGGCRIHTSKTAKINGLG